MPFRAMGFSALCLGALPQNYIVTWTLAACKPGACLSDFEMYVFLLLFLASACG
jgi:hypothetical protein